MDVRIGFGYDVHQLVDGHPFFLGTLPITYHKGAMGHSDADVLSHAICDALLGALALGDIGAHFPDTDLQWKGVSGELLLKKTMHIILQKGYIIANIDTTVVLQEPKIAVYIPQMRSNIAWLLQTDIANVSVKATTTEKLGFVGRTDGITAYAVALLQKK